MKIIVQLTYFLAFFKYLIIYQNAPKEINSNSFVNSNIIFEEDFENSEVFLGLHKQFSEAHSFEIVTDPVFSGNYSGKFELRYGDKRATRTGRRSEVLFPEMQNEERWYSFYVFFPSESYRDDEDSEIISQWHNCCGTPTVSLRNKNGRLLIRITDNRNTKSSLWHNFDLGRVPKNSWNEFVFHIIHSDSATGLVEIWINREKVMAHKGPNMEKGNELPRWKLGIYKSTWDSRATNVDLRIIYFDNITVGNQLAKLSEMVSGN